MARDVSFSELSGGILMLDPEKTTIHVIDDDPLLLETTRLLLVELRLDNKVYQSADNFLEKHKGQRLDRMRGCIISDIQMSGVGGLEFQKILKQMDCSLPIIFISGYADIQIAVKAMRKGAFNFLEKPVRHSALIETINNALLKNIEYLESQLITEASSASLQSLTARETEVLGAILEGLPNKLIAANLNICKRTVEVHRAKIMEKMGATNTVTLVQKVIYAQNTSLQSNDFTAALEKIKRQ
jgi:FixJ family two-component response regulator